MDRSWSFFQFSATFCNIFVLKLCSKFQVKTLENVAENQIKDQEWTILRNGPFLVIFVTVICNTIVKIMVEKNLRGY